MKCWHFDSTYLLNFSAAGWRSQEIWGWWGWRWWRGRRPLRVAATDFSIPLLLLDDFWSFWKVTLERLKSSTLTWQIISGLHIYTLVHLFGPPGVGNIIFYLLGHQIENNTCLLGQTMQIILKYNEVYIFFCVGWSTLVMAKNYLRNSTLNTRIKPHSLQNTCSSPCSPLERPIQMFSNVPWLSICGLRMIPLLHFEGILRLTPAHLFFFSRPHFRALGKSIYHGVVHT